jgi:hypothetical protein
VKVIFGQPSRGVFSIDFQRKKLKGELIVLLSINTEEEEVMNQNIIDTD